MALALFWLFGTLRSITDPFEVAWLNRNIDDPRVRATIFSVREQVVSLGQVCVGPAVGAVDKLYSLRMALLASALLLAPVLPLYAMVTRPRGQSFPHI